MISNRVIQSCKKYVKISLLYIQREMAIFLEVKKLPRNIEPTYLQTLFQCVTQSYDMRLNGKL